MKEILDFDATTLAKKIQSRQISSLEATTAYIEHLERANPSIHALVEERFEQAISEAKEQDQRIGKTEEGGHLQGVPISMKESFHVAGMKTTGGLLARQHLIESEDAEVVRRLKKEGAIILGKTNTPTLCFCQETDNKLYGRTNNPWNLERTAGGSSGGEGALIAIGGAAVGIGSDIGGSIRFPAHFNGVIGFKSGAHHVSQLGHFPYIEDSYQQKMVGMGALAKSVVDAELIHTIITDSPPPALDLSQFRISLPPPHATFPVDQETSKLMKQVRTFYSDSHIVDEEPPPYLERVALLWQLIMSIDGAEDVARVAFGDEKRSATKEWLKEKLFRRSDYHAYLTWALIGANLFKPSPSQLVKLKEKLDQAKLEIEAYLKNRVLILPVYHRTAPPHGQVYKELFSIRKTFLKYIPYVALANTLGLPSLTLPIGTDAEGLPISLQWITACGQEKALFSLAKLAEQSFRGYVRCTAYD